MPVFNQEEALLGAFSGSVKTDGSFEALSLTLAQSGNFQTSVILNTRENGRKEVLTTRDYSDEGDVVSRPWLLKLTTALLFRMMLSVILI